MYIKLIKQFKKKKKKNKRKKKEKKKKVESPKVGEACKDVLIPIYFRLMGGNP